MRYNFGVGMFELGDFSDTEPAHFRETPMNTTIPNKLALRGADDLSCGSGARLAPQQTFLLGGASLSFVDGPLHLGG